MVEAEAEAGVEDIMLLLLLLCHMQKLLLDMLVLLFHRYVLYMIYFIL
jgi:hypothetical protein